MKKALLVLGFSALLLAALPAAPNRRLRLTFAGDIMAHTVNFLMRDHGEIYTGVRHILGGDDLTFANLETPVDPTRPYATYPLFNVHPEYVEAAAAAGVDVFSLANNHSWDQGHAGLVQTLGAMKGLRGRTPRPIWFSGVRDDPRQPFLPESITVNGLRLGFLAVTQFTNDGRRHPQVLTVDYERPAEVEAFLARVREISRPFDLFILSYHGGREYVHEPEPAREELFRRLVRSGVHIVHGHHPHVLQPFDRLRVDGGDRLIIHSAGNLISGMTWKVDPAELRHRLAPMGDSVLYRVEAELDEAGRLSLEVQPLPVANGRNRLGEPVVMPLPALIYLERSPLWAAYYRERSRQIAPFLSPRSDALAP